MTTASDRPQWNSTSVTLEGDIKMGEMIRLISSLVEKRTFRLKIKDLEPSLQLIRDAKFSVELVLRYGETVPQILAQIDQTQADRIVMATRGHMGVRSVLEGSVLC